jgi:enoyl-CoA hydratase/carnithine racemase
MADLLDKISDNMASIYADQSAQGSARSWRDLMLNETWYDADEAVAAGLADRVDEPEAPSDESVAARMAAAFDLSIFAHAGRQNAPAPFLVAAQKVSTVAAARVDPEPKERKHMNMDTFVALLVAASEERRSELIGNHADLLEVCRRRPALPTWSATVMRSRPPA